MTSIGERPLRLGIIGFGRLAQNYYVPALRRIRRPLAICIADPLDRSRAAALTAFGIIPTYADYLEMLHRESLDAVLVATPPSTHLAIWQATGAGGLPVFMEKPFLLADELDQIDPTDPAWRYLMINFNRRFWPTYRWLAERVADGTPGAVLQRPVHAARRRGAMVISQRSSRTAARGRCPVRPR